MAHDIVATIGTYTDKEGQTKYVTRKVGALIETKNGPRIKLDASFNPAGCRRDEDGGVWLAIFEQRERDDGQQRQKPAPQRQQSAPTGGGSFRDDSMDDIPFSPLGKRNHWQ